jgi:hypothetical protein
VRKNGADDAYASGGRLCGSPTKPSGCEQGHNVGSRRIFVDGTTFLLTVVRRIKFVTAEHLPVRTAVSLSKHMKQVLDVYRRVGFRVRTILMDGKFEKLKPLMPSVECNTTAAK